MQSESSFDLLTRMLINSRTDLLYSTSLRMKPRFRLECKASQHDEPVVVTDLACYWDHTENPPGFSVNMLEIVRILRHLSVRKTQISASEEHRTEFSKCMYLAEYRLLTCDLYEKYDSNIRTMNTRKLWSLATNLYIHLALRELPAGSEVEIGLMERLKEVLDDSQQDMLIIWGDSLILLLWILYMGHVVASNGSTKESFFTERIVTICSELNISTVIGFQMALKQVLWLPSFCEPHSTKLWTAVMRRDFKRKSQMTLPTPP
jgi:hypothetical protein